MRTKPRRINLLPKAYRQAERVRKGVMIAGIALFMEVIGFTILVILPSKRAAQQTTAQLDKLFVQMAEYDFQEVDLTLEEIEAVRAEVAVLNAQIKSIQAEHFVSKQMLNSLFSRLPMQVGINTLTISPQSMGSVAATRSVRIEGCASTYYDILSYTTVLEQNFGTRAVQYEISYDDKKMMYTYSIVLDMAVEDSERTLETDAEGGTGW